MVSGTSKLVNQTGNVSIVTLDAGVVGVSGQLDILSGSAYGGSSGLLNITSGILK